MAEGPAARHKQGSWGQRRGHVGGGAWCASQPPSEGTGLQRRHWGARCGGLQRGAGKGRELLPLVITGEADAT